MRESETYELRKKKNKYNACHSRMFLAGIQTCPHENGEMEPQVEVGAH